MASLLRQLVAGPRIRNAEAGLDLCYVESNIIVTSGPSSTYPQRAYRNPTDVLVKFLDEKHGKDWAIWEFRAEGTGYPDSEVYNRIHHYPWPDHHPPPFALIPNIMASMSNWLKESGAEKERVAVVHCQAGKGRSGTVCCSYLISIDGWTMEDALAHFTAKRMRQGFGHGISIPSQLRWVGYVDRWTKIGKKYTEQPVEVMEIHAWGLKDGVKLAIQGFIKEGRKIETFHTFAKNERITIDGRKIQQPLVTADRGMAISPPAVRDLIDSSERLAEYSVVPGGQVVIFKPAKQVILSTSDICIDVERRNSASYSWPMVTAVAHVWFNVYFEGLEDQTASTTEIPMAKDSGVFQVHWEAMDGLKGSSQRGVRALDRLAVFWRVVDAAGGHQEVIEEPPPGEPVPESKPADWRGSSRRDDDNEDVDRTATSSEDHLGGASIPSGVSISKEVLSDARTQPNLPSDTTI